jgi:hypothetical protein
VLKHDAAGYLVLQASNEGLSFSRAERVASVISEKVLEEIGELVDALKSAVVGGCDVLSKIVGFVSGGFARGVLLPVQIDAIFSAIMDAQGRSEPPERALDETTQCLLTDQTPLGCLAIWASTLCETSTSRLCAPFARRDHHYFVEGDDGTSRLDLCDASEHTSGCCNADFIYDWVFMSDLRNMAPMARDPSSGPMPSGSETVILDGIRVPDDWIAPAVVLTGVSVCIVNGLVETQNPITLSAQPSDRCATNKTQPGHVLQGQVEQCVEQDGRGVFSTIVGDGMDTRFAGLNEFVGPYVLGTVRDHFRANVDAALRKVGELGLCCEGSVVHGGNAEIDRSAGRLLLTGGGAASACTDAGSDASVGVPNDGQVDAGMSTLEAGMGVIGMDLSCGKGGEYHVRVTGAWDDEVTDTLTGKIWHRTNEFVSGLQPCVGTIGRLATDTPFCCAVNNDDLSYARCNWDGAKQLCASAGMRLPTKDELIEVASATGTCATPIQDFLTNCGACIMNWQSWSSTEASSTTAYYLQSNTLGVASSLGTFKYSKTTPEGNVGVRCVKDP